MPLTPVRTYDAAEVLPLEGEDAPQLALPFAPSDFYPAGIALAWITADNVLAAYDDNHNDGTQVWPGLINRYDVSTDADGQITRGPQTGGDEHGLTQTTSPVYIGGTFKTEDLSGLDSNGLADAHARVIVGDLTTGLVRIP